MAEYSPTIMPAADGEQMAQNALELFVSSAAAAVENRGVFYTAISGGHTPVGFYHKLAEPSVQPRIPWEHVHLFWVDERCVRPNTEASNFGMAARTFLLAVPIPPSHIHRVSGEIEDCRKAAQEYEHVIRTVTGVRQGIPTLDLIVLGMGADGHIGSIFPNTYELFDTEDLVSTVYRLEGDYSRVTLTIPVLLQARRIMILVSGENKAETLKNIFTVPPDPVLYPVHSLWPVMDKIVWVVDEPAAALLPH